MATTIDGLELVKETYRRYGVGDMDYVYSVLADDVEWRSSGRREVVPTAPPRRGREGVREYFTALWADWVIESHDPQEFIGSGERIAVRTRVIARHKSSAQILVLDKVDLLTVRNGRIQAFYEIFDTAPLERCLGSATAVARGA
jgi:ketosteroid isomerase-like protein